MTDRFDKVRRLAELTPEDLEKARERLGDFWLDRDKKLLRSLFSHIDSQAAQITALKEIAITEKAKQKTGEWYWRQTPPAWKTRYLSEARQQLEAEHPEAFR